MDRLIQYIPVGRVHLDDLFIFFSKLELHVNNLQFFLRSIANAGLKVKITNSTFARPSVSLLGHCVDNEGIHIEKTKIKAISKAPIPNSKTKLHSFFVVAGYYRRFIKGFADISAALQIATSAKKMFNCTAKMIFTFEFLQEKLVYLPFIADPDLSIPFTVERGTAKVASGAVLA